MKLYAYNENSESAKLLAKALNIKRIRHQGKPLVVKGGLINWGASHFKRNIAHDGVLNPPDRVAVATNKLETFRALIDLSLEGKLNIPLYSTNIVTAREWQREGHMVVERHTLTGHSGEGIHIRTKDEEIQQAPLYVRYVPKAEEYRVHVFRDEVFFVQRKARKKDVPDKEVNWKVRNLKGGFIYANVDVVLPEVAKEAAITTIKTIGLDFGAVDIIYNKLQDKYYVLEVNTACGLAGTTLDRYAEQFRKFV